MSNLTLIILIAVVIVVASIATAFGKAVGAGGNVKDLFPEKRRDAARPEKDDLKPDEKSEHNTPHDPSR